MTTTATRYVLIEEKIEQRLSFGITVIDTNCDEQETTAILEPYIDVTSNHQAMLFFIETCNRLQISPLHLHDAVSDFIATL